ncbi:MAG TPA: hypothetical protein VMH86_11540 [Rhizomicrobium sp.]|nr:hypothetical protein [Rhizomicrobium sp.]
MRDLLYVAVLGGLLRIANTFPVHSLDTLALQISYAVTDAALLLGYTGFFLALRDRIGWLGIFGIVLGALGLLTIRLSVAMHVNVYQEAAGLTLVGTALFAAVLLYRRAPSQLAALAWLGATVAGVASLVQPALAVASGVLYGAAFALEGAVLLWQR